MIKRILILAAFFVKQLALASTIVPDTVGASSLADTGFLNIAQSNSAGISYNRFSTFDLQGDALTILNIDSAADIIILEADSFNLDSDIRLVGKTADVVFISTRNYGHINCNACSFKSFSRVTLAVVRPISPLSAASSSIENLNSGIQGQITVNNLYAPDVLILETLSEHLVLTGSNTVNGRVSALKSGGFIDDANGLKTIGAGSIHLNVGSILWSYKKGEIVSANNTNGSTSLRGSIQSPEVKITSSRALDLFTNIDNRVDVISSAQYLGNVVIPSGNTIITSLSSSNLQVFGLIKSPATSGVYSSGSVVINGALNARKVEIVASGTMPLT